MFPKDLRALVAEPKKRLGKKRKSLHMPTTPEGMPVKEQLTTKDTITAAAMLERDDKMGRPPHEKMLRHFQTDTMQWVAFEGSAVDKAEKETLSPTCDDPKEDS